MRTPPIEEIRRLLVALKKQIGDEYRADEEIEVPSMLVTVGCDDNGRWGYQTGDNSFTGGAYGFPHWGIWTLTRTDNCRDAAVNIISQLQESQST